jgi:hypothetical protein
MARVSPSAVEMLVERYGAFIHRVAGRLLTDARDAEEVTQDVLMTGRAEDRHVQALRPRSRAGSIGSPRMRRATAYGRGDLGPRSRSSPYFPGLLLALAAAVAGDSAGYWLGRLTGERVLRMYCRLTLGSGRWRGWGA